MLKKLLYAITGAMVAAGSLYGLATLAAGGMTPVREQVVISLSNYLEKNPDSDIAHSLALWLTPDKEDVRGQLGVLFNKSDVSPISKVCYRDSDGARCVVRGWEEMSLSANSSTSAEPNRLSVPYFIDYAELEVNGPVSSSIALAMGTTTAGFVNVAATTSQASPGDGSPNSGIPDGIIQSTYFVTTSNAGTLGFPTRLATASTTARAEMQAGYRFLISSSSSVRTTGPGNQALGFQSIVVPTSTFVTVFARNVIDITTSTLYISFCDRAGVQCEAVSSTNRGWIGYARWAYHYAIDL